MLRILRHSGVLAFLLLSSLMNTWAQGPQLQPAADKARFAENLGQWKSPVLYELRFNQGTLFLEKNTFTYSFWDAHVLEQYIGDHEHGIAGHLNPNGPSLIPCHAFKMHFEGALAKVKTEGAEKFTHYENYYIGNDPSKWASHVSNYGRINYHNLYRGIDMTISGGGDSLKYDFLVAAGADPNQIQLRFEGVDKLYLKDGDLHYETSVTHIVELHPVAYQDIGGERVPVSCNFKITDNTVSFELPNGYNNNYPLVIDPTLIFASYSGSTTDNWGYTATYDNSGHLYGGGIIFRGPGYPTTPGAFQVTFAGGTGFFDEPDSTYSFACDIGLTKFSPDGSSLIYSTYLGGSGNETPHSLVVDNNDELVVYGATASSNFPTTAGAYDRTFAGGTKDTVSNVIEFTAGSDIFVTKFNASGSALVGSTYMGGTSNDGLNNAYNLEFNYSDYARGEVIVDDNNNVYVASSTNSINFPVTSGVVQSSLSGGQDACVFKLNPNLSSLVWSTYYGGTNDDSGYSLKVDRNGNVFVTGGTKSNNLQGTANGLHPSYMGGIVDGYVLKLNSTATSIVNATYIGTSAYDQSYLLALDYNSNVYIFGQTLGLYPVTPSTVYNVGGSQFIHKLNNDLDSTIFSTRFGSGSASKVNLVPSALRVDLCNNIYLSGWGGYVNINNAPGNHSTQLGTTNGLPLTSDATQRLTDGSDFYFMILSQDADSLVFATYFGGYNVGEHCDGGTSRFDDNGIIYQAVCAGCGGSNAFPTTPGAWSEVNGTRGTGFPNCNLGVVKYAFELGQVDVNVSAFPNTQGCVPFSVVLNPNGVNAESYYWDLGNGQTSTQEYPLATYTDTGTYHVMLIGFDSTTCTGLVFVDTAYLDIIVGDDSLTADFSMLITDSCGPYVAQFTNNSVNWGGSTTDYYWDFGDGQTSILASPTHSYPSTGTYTVTLYASSPGSCNPVDTISKQLTFVPDVVADIFVADTFGCNPFTVEFDNLTTPLNAGQSYTWQYDDGTTNGTTQSPTHTFTTNGTYQVVLTVVDPTTCNVTDSDTISITVDSDSVIADFGENILVNTCDSLLVNLTDQSSNATSWFWDLGDGTTTTNPSPGNHLYASADTFDVIFVVTNPALCNQTDTAFTQFVRLSNVTADIYVDDTFGCSPFTVEFGNLTSPLQGGQSYVWNYDDGTTNGTAQEPTHTFSNNGTFNVVLTVTDSATCNIVDSDTLQIVTSSDSVIADLSSATLVDNCDSLLVDLADQSTNASSWFWDLGDGTTTTNQNPGAHLYTSIDTFNVMLVVTNNLACNNEDTARTQFIRIPPVEALFAPENGCMPLDLTLDNQSTNATSYLWTFHDASTSTDVEPLHTYTTSGTYTIRLTAYNPASCNLSDTYSTEVTVYGLPTAFFTTDGDSFPMFTPVQFTNESTSPAAYFWEFGDAATSTDTDPKHAYANEGIYEPCLSVTDTNTCMAEYCKTLEITFAGLIDVPNAFSPNGDGVNDILFLEGFGVSELEFKIYNRWGELVFESTSLDDGWDGRYKGTDQEMEVYTYTLRASFEDGTKTGLRKGNITLLR